jgi:Metallo-beta-lactamase superfamily
MAKAAKNTSTTGRITNVKIRMYCLGTGDCFVLKYYSGTKEKFTMMIDCGSCQGGPKEFEPYLKDLAAYVNNKIDLLVITHEHNDHVNGFAKCPEIFKAMTIKRAWFAWTEHPDDPGARAKDLQQKKKKMQLAFSNAFEANKNMAGKINSDFKGDFNRLNVLESHGAFMDGLQTLADINLPAAGKIGAPLAGMTAIKKILKDKKTKIDYLEPGTTETLAGLPGLKFHVLGPPYDSESVYKKEKEGTDTYHKKMAAFSDFSLATNAFANIDSEAAEKDIPFADQYIVHKDFSIITSIARRSSLSSEPTSEPVMQAYNAPGEEYRKIDTDWLNSAGALALRLNSHINNTSLVLAVEAEGPGKKVVLLPGDAEYGSWKSWHEIKKWDKKGKDGKHFVEDLLNRTVFYKVSHHLSFNGTALEKGINMMESDELAAMATMDRKRISSKWKGTMPNKFLLNDLITRCKGKLFIMNEFEVKGAPSKTLNPESLGKTVYERKNFTGTKNPIYIQYTCKL